MTRAAVFLLVSLVSPPAQAQDTPDTALPLPAVCRKFKIPPPQFPTEQSPYPPTGRRWPVDVTKAEIVKDQRVAHRLSEYFRPLSLKEVRANLTEYLVVSREEWEHDYSHVAFSDEGAG